MVNVRRILDLEDIQEDKASPDELIALIIAEKEIAKGEVKSWKEIRREHVNLESILEQAEVEELSPDELIAIKIAEKEIANGEVKSWKELKGDV